MHLDGRALHDRGREAEGEGGSGGGEHSSVGLGRVGCELSVGDLIAILVTSPRAHPSSAPSTDGLHTAFAVVRCANADRVSQKIGRRRGANCCPVLGRRRRLRAAHASDAKARRRLCLDRRTAVADCSSSAFCGRSRRKQRRGAQSFISPWSRPRVRSRRGALDFMPHSVLLIPHAAATRRPPSPATRMRVRASSRPIAQHAM